MSKKDVLHREKYLKTSWGKRYIKTWNKYYLTGLGEASTTKVAKAKDAKGFVENKDAARIGGKIAGNARKELKKESGENIISSKNYLSEKKIKKLGRK